MAQQEYKTIPNRTIADWSSHLRDRFLRDFLRNHWFHDTFNCFSYRFLISSNVCRRHTTFDSVLTESRSKSTWLAAKDDYTINWFSNKHLLRCVCCFRQHDKFLLTHKKIPYVDYIFVRDVQESSRNFCFFLSFQGTGTVCACVITEMWLCVDAIVCDLLSCNRPKFMFHMWTRTIFLPDHLVENFDSENVWPSMCSGRLNVVLGLLKMFWGWWISWGCCWCFFILLWTFWCGSRVWFKDLEVFLYFQLRCLSDLLKVTLVDAWTQINF